MAAFFPRAIYLPFLYKCKLDEHSILNHFGIVMYNARPIVGR